jgi:hypothetical protein
MREAVAFCHTTLGYIYIYIYIYMYITLDHIYIYIYIYIYIRQTLVGVQRARKKSLNDGQIHQYSTLKINMYMDYET